MQPSWPHPVRNYLPFFKTYRLGPVLAYNLCKTGTQTRGREKLLKIISKLKPESKILMCFGEIDCRAHLLKQAKKQQQPIQVIVADCVDRYLSVAFELQHRGFEVAIWNVIPPTPVDLTKAEYPSFGTQTKRAQVTRLFNQTLAHLTVQSPLTFISIYDQLVTPRNVLKKRFFVDQIHLSQKAMPIALKTFAHHYSKIDFSKKSSPSQHNSCNWVMNFAMIRYMLRWQLFLLKQRIIQWAPFLI